ncbi:M3 family metallopeptidase [Roseibacillus ishigakijimensis]|uniref:oligopeptidase A n=1 Tax=Roseibacillus ishigakijimensis TaxID=454146 RepID=A0A934RVH1_9BACT|nr:M3 family metallopeptidase [Roseibacillus ishigakijimensis]MBK1835206.1 M3 family metallopeptidase [Roseibacillus ishigakijimensis]
MSTPHPFLAEDFEIRWSTLTPEHAAPDVRLAIAQAGEALAAIKALPESELSYASTFRALEAATEPLGRAWGRLNHLDSVSNNPAQREALNELLPEVSAFYSSISLDGDLWQKLKAFAESPAVADLPAVEQRFVDETCHDFISSGADLAPEEKKRMAEISSELAQLTQKFSENVLDSTNAFELYLSDESRLAGLPASAREAAAEDAAAKGREGEWRFTLHFPSLFPVLQHAEDEELRREIWSASSRIASTGEHDNTELIWKIIKLRQEKAALLGFANFADLTLQRRMAENGEKALGFVEDLHGRITDVFQEESRALEAYKARQTGQPAGPLQPWEVAYWAEKQRKERYDFDDEILRPYFPVNKVMAGMFSITSQLFGIEIAEKKSVYLEEPGETGEEAFEVWHPECKFYEIRDAGTGEHLGSFYADWHPRESKRGGAWMNCLEAGLPPREGQARQPHLGLIMGNMTKPVGGKPALLTHSEVETIFHEFGHLLHQLLSEVPVKSLSGTSVPWDFVELPSQIMENFCWDRESLDLFARHYETDEPIPEELFQKMLAARNYLSATAFMRQLAFGKLDLELHVHTDRYLDRDLDEVDKEILAAYRAPLASEVPSRARSFSHLFSSSTGYAAGYYSYKWAEVLDADAFTRFQKEGVMNETTGRAFRESILSRGNSRPVDESFREFMGRDPDLTALLVRSGLA